MENVLVRLLEAVLSLVKVAVALICIVQELVSAYVVLNAVKSNQDPESTKVSQVGLADPSYFATAYESVN